MILLVRRILVSALVALVLAPLSYGANYQSIMAGFFGPNGLTGPEAAEKIIAALKQKIGSSTESNASADLVIYELFKSDNAETKEIADAIRQFVYDVDGIVSKNAHSVEDASRIRSKALETISEFQNHLGYTIAPVLRNVAVDALRDIAKLADVALAVKTIWLHFEFAINNSPLGADYIGELEKILREPKLGKNIKIQNAVFAALYYPIYFQFTDKKDVINSGRWKYDLIELKKLEALVRTHTSHPGATVILAQLLAQEENPNVEDLRKTARRLILHVSEMDEKKLPQSYAEAIEQLLSERKNIDAVLASVNRQHLNLNNPNDASFFWLRILLIPKFADIMKAMRNSEHFADAKTIAKAIGYTHWNFHQKIVYELSHLEPTKSEQVALVEALTLSTLAPRSTVTFDLRDALAKDAELRKLVFEYADDGLRKLLTEWQPDRPIDPALNATVCEALLNSKKTFLN